ncbi:MAG: C-GCAxxG-C-C family protein [Clostridia bacterium]|nr:C-GCAxxG-C-C family protein [Clostridia bacterium]
MDRKELASNYFKEGYSCSQAVVLAFKDLIDLDEETLIKVASSFGGGMARMREVCGCVSGMFIVEGLLHGYTDPKAGDEKTKHYTNLQSIAAKFREENGSIICRELLGGVQSTNPAPDARTPEYYKKRPCAELAGLAAEILDNYLKDKK